MDICRLLINMSESIEYDHTTSSGTEVVINDAQSRVDDERSGHHVPTLLAIMDHSVCFTICETLVTATLAFVYLPFTSTCTCYRSWWH